MSEQPFAGQPADDPSAAIPYEAIPALAANEDYIAKLERLRELKAIKDTVFNDKEPKKPGDLPLGEYAALKLEVAAINLVNGHSSVVYNDLRVARVPGGEGKDKVTGAKLAPILHDSLVSPEEAGGDRTLEMLLHVIAAAEAFDPSKLLEAGVPVNVILAATTPGKPRSASIRVEWVGAKGRGAGQKARATGGPVQ